MTTETTGFQANLDIIKSLGLDPSTIRPGATITFDRHLGPILTVEVMLVNHRGQHYTVDGENVATELKRYKLVPIDEPDAADVA